MKNPRVMVIGANGFIGRRLTMEMIAAGFETYAAIRSERDAAFLPGAMVVKCDMRIDDSRIWAARLKDVDIVLNCAGIIRDHDDAYDHVHDKGARALFEGARTACVQKVIQISALGASHDATAHFLRSKWAADEHLQGMDDIDWAILRPSIVVGHGGRSTTLLTRLAILPLPPRIGPGTWRIQPIHIDDVARCVLSLVRADGPTRRIIDLVGPRAMTTDEITSILRRSAGLPDHATVPIPAVLQKVGVLAMERLTRLPVTRESLSMLEAGSVGDPCQIIRLTGMKPVDLEVALAKSHLGEGALAGETLIPARHILRLLLAFIWLCGGIIPLLFTPWETNRLLLEGVGLAGRSAVVAMVAGAVLDVGIGVALAFRWKVGPIMIFSMLLMTFYTLVLTRHSPDLWADPFGALVKNAAVLGLSFSVWATERRHG